MNPYPNILIIEDTLDFAKLNMLTLRRAGYHVCHVLNGDEAVQIARQYKPDVILLDLNLPGMSGWQVLESIRQFDDVPIIVTTAYTDGANRIVGKLHRVHRYLTKPYAPAQLLQAVHEVVRKAARV